MALYDRLRRRPEALVVPARVPERDFYDPTEPVELDPRITPADWGVDSGLTLAVRGLSADFTSRPREITNLQDLAATLATFPSAPVESPPVEISTVSTALGSGATVAAAFWGRPAVAVILGGVTLTSAGARWVWVEVGKPVLKPSLDEIGEQLRERVRRRMEK